MLTSFPTTPLKMTTMTSSARFSDGGVDATVRPRQETKGDLEVLEVLEGWEDSHQCLEMTISGLRSGHLEK